MIIDSKNMFNRKSQSLGFTLVELLVAITVSVLVSMIIVQHFFSMQDDYSNTVESYNNYREDYESQAIFRALIEEAYISGNSTYSIFKQRNTAVGNQQVNPFNYPLIYAQQESGGGINGFTLNNIQANTDVLVLQTIENPFIINSTINSTDRSISVNSADTGVTGNNQYLMLTDETHQTLLEASSVNVNAQSGTTQITLANDIGQIYPSGSTLYTGYTVRFIYVRNSGDVDEVGNPVFELFERTFINNNNGSSGVLLRNVSNLQIQYGLSDGSWHNVQSSLTNPELWYGEIKGVRLSYDVNGESKDVIVALSNKNSM